MIVLDKLVQGSDEWLNARSGVITASCFNKIITPTGKATTGKTRRDYMLDLIHEQITKTPIESYTNAAMQRGNDLEPEARETFEFIKDIVVNEVGIIYQDDSKLISCSPDGLIGKSQGIEIKCPLHKAHIETLLSQTMPKCYIQQVQGCMMVSGRSSWWYVSYHPLHKPFMTLINRDDDYIKLLEKALKDFILELNELKDRII